MRPAHSVERRPNCGSGANSSATDCARAWAPAPWLYTQAGESTPVRLASSSWVSPARAGRPSLCGRRAAWRVPVDLTPPQSGPPGTILVQPGAIEADSQHNHHHRRHQPPGTRRSAVERVGDSKSDQNCDCDGPVVTHDEAVPEAPESGDGREHQPDVARGRLLRNGAERSGGQVVRMRPGRRAPEHAYSCNTQARSTEGPGAGGPHGRSRSGDTSSTVSQSGEGAPSGSLNGKVAGCDKHI